jgi:hypothetical protein
MAMALVARGDGSWPSLHALDGAAQMAAGGTNGIRRRRRRCRSKLPREIINAAINNVATSIAARCSHESDPLAVVLCESAGPPYKST